MVVEWRGDTDVGIDFAAAKADREDAAVKGNSRQGGGIEEYPEPRPHTPIMDSPPEGLPASAKQKMMTML